MVCGMSTVTHLHLHPQPQTYAEMVAANVRAEMARQRLQQKTVAEALGVPKNLISDRARGRTPWTLNELETVARLLGTTVSELCAIRDSNPEPAD